MSCLLAACSGGTTTVLMGDHPDSGVDATVDAGPDKTAEDLADLAAPDLPAETAPLDLPDAQQEATGPECAPGEGCFLDPCTENVCTENRGCTYPPAVGDCDDGEACTLGDHCKDGVCVGEAVPCECKTDQGCAALEDGNACNGELFCDKTHVPFSCEVDPASMVSCPHPTGDASFCRQAVCDPANGSCSFAPANEGAPCSDKDACTVLETCSAGACTGGVPLNCNDGNLCTDDSCDSAAGCMHAANTAVCSDDDACTAGDACLGGVCVQGAPISCGADNTTSLRPTWHGDVAAQCQTICWIATGNSSCVSSATGVKSGTTSGWMYTGSPVSCDPDGRQYSEVTVPTVGKQIWSFDKMSWQRNGSFSGYRCNW